MLKMFYIQRKWKCSLENITCTSMFIAALFRTAETWEQPECPSTEEWVKRDMVRHAQWKYLFLFCLVWWAFILFLYLLGIPLSLHLVYIAEFGMAFLYSGSLWSSLYCGVSSLWVGLYRWLVKVSWLGKLVSVFWWVEMDFFSLECNEVSSNELWDVSGFGVTLGRLYIKAQGCVPVLLENLHGMSCSGTCWPLGGAWFQYRYGGVWWAPVN